jgi:hypothetical protein
MSRSKFKGQNAGREARPAARDQPSLKLWLTWGATFYVASVRSPGIEWLPNQNSSRIKWVNHSFGRFSKSVSHSFSSNGQPP